MSIYSRAIDIINNRNLRTSDPDLVELHDWRYSMNMGCMVDYWMLGGVVVNHPDYDDYSYVYVSSPKSFNDNMIVVTASGRRYKLMECGGNLKEQIGFINESINNGGYSRH